MIVSLALATAMSVSASAKILNIKRISQYAYSGGCWAASGAAVCRYYKNSTTTLAEFAHAAGADDPNKGNFNLIQAGLRSFGISSTFIMCDSSNPNALTFDKLQAQINANHPIIADVGAHAVVIAGYEGRNLYIADPNPSEIFSNLVSVPYDGMHFAAYNNYEYSLGDCLFTNY